jgi:phospholipid-translocating ATPase
MGVLMKNIQTGQVHMFEKGADDVILSRLNSKSSTLYGTISAQHLKHFAEEGLRTLCVAHKVMEPAVYADWKREYHDANTSIENRDVLLEAVYAKIECEFNLIGASAIKDRLQDRVPQTIADLRDANIRFWMLTGDTKHPSKLDIRAI